MNQKSIAPNPYDVLEVSPGASSKKITVAFAMAMKRRKYPPDAIALARKSLMNPQERIIADYLRPITNPIQRFKRSNLSALDTLAPKLEFLSEFDGLEKAIADSNKVLESDCSFVSQPVLCLSTILLILEDLLEYPVVRPCILGEAFELYVPVACSSEAGLITKVWTFHL